MNSAVSRTDEIIHPMSLRMERSEMKQSQGLYRFYIHS